MVDDEDGIRQMLRDYLEKEGFDVVQAADGPSALETARGARPDVVVLDIMMPGMDGIEVLRQLRRESEVYVIMLTARADEVDKLVGLSVGADDYVTKPFSPRELVARVKTVLRRRRSTDSPPHSDDALEFEGLSIDSARREARHNGHAVALTALEFDLLATLARAPGRVFSRRQLLEQVWGFDFYGDERVVDVHIASIRRALDDDAAEPRFIGTVRGVGYKFVGAPR